MMKAIEREEQMKRFIFMLLILSTVLWMPLGSHADEEFYGIVENRPEGKIGTWVIGGRQVEVTEKTEIDEDDGPLVIGACAQVEYDGNLVEEIESEDKSKCGA
jgi:hypothetical protein